MTTKEPSGRAKGGIARREALSPQERGNIARKAATARWGLASEVGEAWRPGSRQEVP